MQRSVKRALPAALALLPLCLVPGAAGLRFGWQLASLWAAAALFAVWLESWWLRAFFALCAVHVFIRGPVATAYLQLLLIAVYLAAVKGFAAAEPWRVRCGLLASAVLLCGWIAAQRLGAMPELDFPYPIRAAGPFNPNAAAVLLVLCLPAFFTPAGRWLLPIPLAGLFACGSVTGMAAGFAAAAVWAVTGENRKAAAAVLAVAAALLALFAALVLADPSDLVLGNARWHAWGRILQSAPDALLGRGPGSFAAVFPLLTASDPLLAAEGVWTAAHNEYLQALFELGLPGLALIGAFLALQIRRFWIIARSRGLTADERRCAAGLAAVAVSCAGWHTFHIAPLALAGCAWLGQAQNMAASRSVAPNFGRKSIDEGSHSIHEKNAEMRKIIGTT